MVQTFKKLNESGIPSTCLALGDTYDDRLHTTCIPRPAHQEDATSDNSNRRLFAFVLVVSANVFNPIYLLTGLLRRTGQFLGVG